MLQKENTKTELKNLKYLPMFGNYFLVNKFVDKICSKGENVVYAVLTQPQENAQELTVFTCLDSMKNSNECFVQVKRHISIKKDFGDTSNWHKLDYLKFERFCDSNTILCTRFAAVNGFDRKPYFAPVVADSCLLKADTKSFSPLGIDFININGFVFANKIESFRFNDYQKINTTPELHKDASWAEMQNR